MLNEGLPLLQTFLFDEVGLHQSPADQTEIGGSQCWVAQKELFEDGGGNRVVSVFVQQTLLLQVLAEIAEHAVAKGIIRKFFQISEKIPFEALKGRVRKHVERIVLIVLRKLIGGASGINGGHDFPGDDEGRKLREQLPVLGIDLKQIWRKKRLCLNVAQ